MRNQDFRAPQVDHRAGEGPGDAVDRLHPCDHQLAQLVDVAGLAVDDYVVGAGDVLGSTRSPLS